MKFLRKIQLTYRAAVASVCISALMIATGCTPAQKQTTLQVVTAINTHIPEVVAAAQTAAAVISGLLPADAALIGVADTAFTQGANTLQALTGAYIASPNATVLAQIQAAITALEGQINTATLNAVGIKDTQLQSMVLAALKGLLTVVTVVFALVAPTMTTAQLERLRGGVRLRDVRTYMDAGELAAAEPEIKAATGMNWDQAFAAADRYGL